MLRRKTTDRKLTRRRGSVMLAIGVVSGLSALPGTAQAGFFEQLFGGFQAQPAPPPAAMYEPAPGVRTRTPVRRFHRAAALIGKPVLQKTTDLMRDKTLRVGDAVMMKDGLHIYAGTESDRHVQGQFVPLDEARHVPSKERVELAALDTTRNDPLAEGKAPDTIASGRSAAVGTPIVSGYRITDVKGASVRYVGP